jgi:hypothetical protein
MAVLAESVMVHVRPTFAVPDVALTVLLAKARAVSCRSDDDAHAGAAVVAAAVRPSTAVIASTDEAAPRRHSLGESFVTGNF